jgi:hypothetical protein
MALGHEKGEDTTEKWLEFYRPFFRQAQEASQFVRLVEDYSPDNPMHLSKIMMHQTQRLVPLADDLPKIRPDRDSLQLLFLIICAENVAKLHDNFTREGRSRSYVQRFFTLLVSQTDQDILARGFVLRHPKRTLNIEEVANLLYEVRCDVVHEGMYWGFFFRDKDTTMMNPKVNVSIGLSELRDIVIRGCINAIIDSCIINVLYFGLEVKHETSGKPKGIGASSSSRDGTSWPRVPTGRYCQDGRCQPPECSPLESQLPEVGRKRHSRETCPWEANKA